MINSSVEYGCFKCCLVFCSYRNSSNGSYCSYFQGTKISRIINFTFTIATYFQISSSPVNIYTSLQWCIPSIEGWLATAFE